VYVEKPLALKVASGVSLVNTAVRTGQVLMVGHMLCYHPAVRRIKALISRGELGDLYYMYALRVNLGRLRSDENALWSFGPHDLSVMLHLLDERPQTVAARGRAFLQAGIEDVVFLNLNFPSGVMAQIQLSWLDPRKERKLTIVGSRKMLEFDDVSPVEKLRIFDKGFERPPDFQSFGEYLSIRHGDVLIPRLEMVEPLRLELAHFVESCLTRKQPLTDGRSGLAVVRILAAADLSMQRGGAPVTLEEVEG
jgi:predicted dehydrogenase